VVIATLPAVVAGFLLQTVIEQHFRSSFVVAINLLVVALLMIFAEWYIKKPGHLQTTIEKLGRRRALAIGLAQAASLVPGVSRSGATITAGLFSGLDRVSATRFSFLLSLPITFGAIVKVVLIDGAAIGGAELGWGSFVVGILAAGVSGGLAIVFMLRYLAKHTLHIFAYFRIVVAAMVILMLTIR
jgi:undecaprenyl-diphosphatase